MVFPLSDRPGPSEESAAVMFTPTPSEMSYSPVTSERRVSFDEEWKKALGEEIQTDGSGSHDIEMSVSFRPTQPVISPEQQALVEEAWKKTAKEFEIDFRKMETKFHRFPASLRGLGSRYIGPMAVAIGPYHNPSKDCLQEMESIKDVVAFHFIRGSGHSFEEMYAAVLSSTDDARSLYAEDYAVAGIAEAEFALMMFRDGCFLLQFMLSCTTGRGKLPQSLLCFFHSNQAVINNDIMLLENQIPWGVIETLRRFRSVPVEEFIARMGRTFQVRGDVQRQPFVLDGSYKPPHLLGLLRFFKTGSNIVARQDKWFSVSSCCCFNNGEVPPPDGLSLMSKTISAIHLQEIGIKLRSIRTTKFMDMGIKIRPIFSEIFLPSLLLDDVRSCWLVNMAAFEVCMAAGSRNHTEKLVVCSYLAVLAMLMDREEDAHELRSKRLVQGELTNKETLDFFKSLIKRITGGSLYIQMLEEIEDYKHKRWMWIKVHKFVYKNFKTIITMFSVIGILVGIFKTLLSLKQHKQ